MKSHTAAISIQLPEKLALVSQKVAQEQHMSRAQFIRIAIEEAVRRWRVQQEQMEMVKCFKAMKKNKRYLRESDDLMGEFNTPFDDKDGWWKKK